MSSVSDLEEEDVGEPPVASAASAGGRGNGMGYMAKSTHASKGKRLSVERIYQEMSQLEHVLLRPNTYVSSVEPVTQNMWVYDPEDDDGGAEEQDEERDKDGGCVHYNYLLGMPLWRLTMERKDDLLKKRDETREELEVLRHKSPENLWEEDLDAFCANLDELEQAQRDEENSTAAVASNKAESETKTAAFAERVVPKVEWEAKAKTTGARRGAAKKATGDAAADGLGDDGDGNPATLTSTTSPGVLERGTDSALAKAPLGKRGSATKDTSSMTKTKSKKRKNSRSGSDSSGNYEPPNSVGSDDDLKPVASPSVNATHWL
ncbi:hypothetical protein MRX96_022507 [Rhipicephalus microplus]